MSIARVLIGVAAVAAVGYGLKRVHDVLNGEDTIEKTALDGKVKIKLTPNKKTISNRTEG